MWLYDSVDTLAGWVTPYVNGVLMVGLRLFVRGSINLKVS